MHCEYYDGGHQPHRQIHLASSADKGLTWKYEGPIVTRDNPDVPARKFYNGKWEEPGLGGKESYVNA
jgi:hypothetical protein